MAIRPNILLVVIDCARADKWLGPARHSLTPNVDRLGAAGARLSTLITEKACTTPCFASLLSGCFSPRHGMHLVWGYRLPPGVPLLTERLADAGYNTYAEMTGPLLSEMGLDRGFSHYTYRAPCDYLHTAWGKEFRNRLGSGYYRAPWLIVLHLWELHARRHVPPEMNAPRYGRDSYEQAVSALDVQLGQVFEAAGADSAIIVTGDHGEKTRADDYPPGSAVHYTRDALDVDQAGGLAPVSVANWAGPSVLQALYGASAPRLRAMTLADLRAPGRFSRSARLRDRLRLLRLTPWVLLTDLLALGVPQKLTRMLERRGLLDPKRAAAKVDRFRAALGDRELLQMHLRMWIHSYGLNYEEGHIIHVYDILTRVPFVIRWNGAVPAGFESKRLVRQVDILPTLLELLGVSSAVPSEVDGRSFAGLLRGKAWTPTAAYQSVTGLPADLEIRGVRTETHRYTYGPHNAGLPQELYDLKQDPGEQTNLAKAAPELCGELRNLASSFLPAGGEVNAEELAVAGGSSASVEQRLRGLGYLD